MKYKREKKCTYCISWITPMTDKEINVYVYKVIVFKQIL